ncbi:TonB-dependent receptor [Pseudanabaena mucicola]|uniref:TonB-dependent receptor n=1 Tax=Pseudanabaena mucicola TaxID=71190 RepID=UPI0025776F96|nr:TonB-dependent receptor [Pseudanabaena mucicola]
MNRISILLTKSGFFVIPQILLLLGNSPVNAKLDQNINQNINQDINQDINITSSTPQASPTQVKQPQTAPNTAISPKITILSPTTGTVIDSPAATVVIQLPLKTKIELLVNGKVINSNLVGRSELDEANQTVTQTWYGVPLQAGDNTIAARAIGGDPSLTSSVNLKVRGVPVKLSIKTLETRIPADGRSYATVDGQLIDENGNRSNWDALVTLEASDGEFIGTDASPEQPGFQVQARQGKFTAQLRASLKTGQVTVRSRDGQMEAFTQLQFETDLRPSLVTGVIDLRFGARGTDFYRSLREFLPIDRDNRAQLDFNSAVFGTGRVGEWLITGALNSSRPLIQDCAGNSSLSSTIKYCDPLYPTTGDSSTSTLTTPSYDSLYLRLERNSPVQGAGTDYFMWGNFNTQEFTSRSQQFSALNRQLQGFKGNFNLGDLQITGFYSNVGKSFQRDTIAPNGTSGTYFLSNRFVVNGSENVFIELIDFFSSGTVVLRKQLTRGTDYDINYDNGSILFRKALLQTELGDAGQLLRRQIVVTYESEKDGNNSNLYAGQLRYYFNRSQNQPSWIGANYFKESLGIRNFSLYGANALISLTEKTQLIAEYAQSQNDSEILGFVSGSAIRFDLNSELFSGILGRLYYSKAETGFTNNATISFVPGQTKYGGQLTAKFSPTTSFQFQYDQEDNKGIAPRPLTSLTDLLTPRQEAIPGSAVDNSLRTISLGLQQNIGAAILNLDLLYRDRQDRQPPNVLTSNSTQLRSRLSLPIAENLKLTAQNEVSLSATADVVIPDRSVLALDWTIVQGLTARIGQQWFQSGSLAGTSITSADLLGEYKLGSDTSLIGRYSLLSGINNTSTQGSVGLNHRWQILSGLRLNFGYERIFGDFTPTTTTGTPFLQPFAVGQSSSSLTFQSGDSYNIGIEYTDNPDFKASAKFENRSDRNSSNTVFTAAALGKLSPAFTLLFNYQQSTAANQLIAGLGTIASLKVGLAYRDPQDDKFNALLRYEYRQNPNTIPDSILLGSGSGFSDNTLALEGIYAPNWQWEFYGKFALRNSTTTIARDFIATSLTTLSQFRLTYRLGYNFELVGETRILNQPTASYSEVGLVGELGYYLTPNLRLAAGYSSGSINADRDYSGTRSAGGLYAGITVKLNELFDGFGLQKTPPRQQVEPVEPQAPVAQPPAPTPKVAAVPNTPQIISLNVARSLTFRDTKQAGSTDLAIADIAILENLVAVLKEYGNLSLDIQAYIGSLADMNSGDNLAANRMMVTRKYLMDRGVTSQQMTLRSLGSLALNNTERVSTANSAPIKFALSGQAEVFNAIATRLQTISSNSPATPATEFLQSLFPKIDATLQAEAASIPTTLPPNKTNISLGVNVGNDGKIADLSYSSLDRIIERLKSSSTSTLELQTGNINVATSQDLEMFKLLAVRSYLLDKGISSDRIIISVNPNNSSQNSSNNTVTPMGTSQVFISLNVDDGNTNIAAKPITPTASANTAVPTLALLLGSDRRQFDQFNWLESSLINSSNFQFTNSLLSTSIQLPNLGELPQLLTQLPSSIDSFLLATNITNREPNEQDRLTIAESSTRRLATAFNFLLSNQGDTLTALLQAMGISTSQNTAQNNVQKSGFEIAPDQLLNLINPQN